MFENMNEQQARDAILESVKNTVIYTIKNLTTWRETEYHMHPVCMIHTRW